MKNNLYEINLKEFRKIYDCGDFFMLNYIKDFITDDLIDLYTDVMNYNEIYGNGWTIKDLFKMGKKEKYWTDKANDFIKKYNVPKNEYNEYSKYFEKYVELRNELLDELGLDDRYLDQDITVDDIPEYGFYESEIITTPKDFQEGYSYTVARVRNFGHCTELHYCDGKATVEYGDKITHDYWESEIDNADWFEENMGEEEIINKLVELFEKHYEVKYEYEL